MMKFLKRVQRTTLPLGAALSLFLWTGCASSHAPDSSAEAEAAQFGSVNPAENLENFNAAWEIIYESHYDTNFNGVDWIQVGNELRPRAAMARDQDELRKIIQEMLDRLGQSHMAVFPGTVVEKAKRPERSEETDDPAAASTEPPVAAELSDDLPDGSGDVGLDVRLRDGEIWVFKVEAGGPADTAGVLPGWIIKSIDGTEVAELLEEMPPGMDERQQKFVAWRLITGSLSGPPGSTVEVAFLDGSNEPAQRELRRRLNPGVPVKLGLLPTLYTRFEKRRIEPAPGRLVGYLHFNVWMIPVAPEFDAAIDEFRDADGTIIDLRGNIGGIGALTLGVSGHFLNDRLSLGTMKMRGSEMHFYTNPRRVNSEGEAVSPYTGPVAILVDDISLSAAEIFAGGMQDLGRARVFGETTGGQALPAMWDRLPNGDVLYHVFADFVTPSGTRFEGRGVIPDTLVEATRQDLLAGRDPVLDAAVEWLLRAPAGTN